MSPEEFMKLGGAICYKYVKECNLFLTELKYVNKLNNKSHKSEGLATTPEESFEKAMEKFCSKHEYVMLK